MFRNAAYLGWPKGRYTHKFGLQPAVTTAFRTVWPEAGLYPAWDSAASVVSVSSASGSDTGDITIIGLAATTFLPLRETITMTGATPSLTTASFARVFRAAYNKTAGVATNVGLITGTISGDNCLLIRAGVGQTEQAIFTVNAAVKRAYLLCTQYQCGKGDECNFVAYVREPGGAFHSIDSVLALTDGESARAFAPLDNPIVGVELLPKTDVDIRVQTVTGTGRSTSRFTVWEPR